MRARALSTPLGLFALFALSALFAPTLAACSGAPGDDVGGDGGDGALDGDAIGDGAIDPDADATPDGTLGPDAGAACVVNGVVGVCVDVSMCTGASVATPGHCPGPSNIQCCTPKGDGGGTTTDSSAWCPTDPTARPNEGLVEEPGVGGCPAGMLPIGEYCATAPNGRNNVDISRPSSGLCASGLTHGVRFCIDRFEASIVVRNADGSESSWTPYYEPRASDAYRAVSLRGAVPQAYISGNDAKRACEASGKRLCSDLEWQRACRGLDDFVYPYGNTRKPGVCNDESLHPVYSPEECFGTNASWIYGEIDYAGIDQQANTLSLTGAHAQCVTPEGVYDLMGNVHDWIYDPLNLTSPTKGVDFRGGYYNDTKINGEGCLYNTDAHGLNQVDYSVGFRCCASAP
jgi:hypothetical protein